MSICLYTSLGTLAFIFFSWVIPILENLSSFYPSIVLIEGMKKASDPPLYSALLSTLQSFEHIHKEYKSIEVPLYDKSTSVIPDTPDPDFITLYLIRNELNIENPAFPQVTRVSVISRPIQELFNGTGEWIELWSMMFDGEIYMVSRNKCGNDLAFIYRRKMDEGQEHIVRYFPSYKDSFHYDFVLNGANEVSSFSMCDGTFVYSRLEGFYSFHVLRLRVEDGLAVLDEVDKGELMNRTFALINEVTGAKILKINETLYVFQFKAVQINSQSSVRIQLSVYKLMENQTQLLGQLYNVSLDDYVQDAGSSFDYLSLPIIRASLKDTVFIGHYNNFIMFIRNIDLHLEAYFISSSFSAEFTRMDITESGRYLLIVNLKQSIPGNNEKERLRLIRVDSTNGIFKEGSFDLALDHLPSSLIEKNIKNLKLIEYNDKVFALIFYSNGVMVLIDFHSFLDSDQSYDFKDDSWFRTILTLLVVSLIVFWVLCGRRARIAVINIR